MERIGCDGIGCGGSCGVRRILDESSAASMLLEAAHTSDPSFDPAMVSFKSIIQVDARPVADVAAQRRADCAWVGVMPVGCHRSGTKPATARAERKNLWAALMSRVALSIVSMRFPSRSIARYK